MQCSFCNKAILDTKYKTRNRKRYHEECYNQLINKAESTNQHQATSIKEGDKEALENYIRSLYNLTELPYPITKQIENFISQQGYTYSGIQKTLYYFYELNKNNPDSHKSTIGIVPYIYDEAKAFFQSLHEANESNKDFIQEERTVHIKLKPKDRRLPCIISEQPLKEGENHWQE